MFSALRLAFRQFAKTPGFTVIAVLTLALGIGANTAFFSVINNALLRPLPYPNQERIVYINEYSNGGEMSVSYPNFQDWQRQQDTFAALAFHFGTQGVKLKTTERSERVSCMLITSEFFSALGVQPALGRLPNSHDDNPGTAPSVWLTDGAWQRYFASAKGIVGQAVQIDGRDVVVAGILPAKFRFVTRADIYMPVGPFASENLLTMRASHSNSFAIGLLKPGVSLATAQGQMSVIAQRLQREYPTENGGIDIRLALFREHIASGSRTNLLLLCGAVGTVLLIACVNIANMLLARSFTRTKEMAIRTALGATRGQLIRQLLTESLMLAFAGGLLGTVVGLWGYGLVERLVPWQVQPLLDASDGIDLRVLAFTIGVTLLTGVGFGLAPACHLSQANPNDALKQTVAVVHTRWGSWRLRDLLVGVQVALALVLLVGASLLIRSFQHVLDVNPGIRPDHVLSLQVTAPPMEKFQKEPNIFVTFYEQAIDSVSSLPGVESCAIGSNLPFTWGNSSIMFYLDGQPVPESSKFPSASYRSVSKDFFQTLGIPLLQGKIFDGSEPTTQFPPGITVTPENLGVIFKGVVLQAVVSRSMADKYWPGENAVGKRFTLGFPGMGLPAAEVIGIVGDVTRNGLERGPTPEFYVSYRQFVNPGFSHLVLKTKTDPAGMTHSVRNALAKAFPDQPIYDVRVMNDRMEERISGRKFNLRLFVFFAGTALLLALIGLYGVLAFVVGQRTREIGIRMALGARQSDVLRDILRRGLFLVVPGLLFGSIGAWAASQFLQNQLYSITRNDATSYAISAGLLTLAAILACLLPARRATRVNPVVALRAE
ncbi:MAG: ABC transporter permease [Nibricoccus sp.]